METDDPTEIPRIKLDVLKDGELIETIMLENRWLFKFGRGGYSDSADTVELLHESIS